MAKAMTALNAVVGVGTAFVYFFTQSDRSSGVLASLVALLLVALVFPAILSARAERLLAVLPSPVPTRVRQIVVYPVWAAFVVLMVALFALRYLT